MAINYTTLLGLAQPVTGTESNVWGDVVNDSITALLDSAIAGTATISLTAGDVTLTDVDGAADQARMAILVLTGTPGTTRNVVAPSQSKTYIVVNQSDSSAVIKGSATTGVTVRAGQAATCVWNGADFEIVASGDVDGPASATDNAIVRYDGATGKLIQNSAVTIDDSNNVSGVVQLNATTVDTTNIEVTNLKAKDGTAAGSIADSTGIVTFASTVLTTTDINGGTIDATSIGATTPSTVVATQVDITAQGDLRLQDTTGGQYVALQAPGTVATSYTLTLPVDDGTAGQALITDGSGVLSWSTAASGDVYGPASATDNAVARYDGTTGKIIQNSAVTIADDGATVIAANSATDGLRITQVGTGNALLVEDSANPDATPFVIDNGGKVVSGYTTAITYALGFTPILQGNYTSGAAWGISRWSNDTTAPRLSLAKSRGADVGTRAIALSGDDLGTLVFEGDDGAAFIRGAQIVAQVDGTPGTNDMPGRLLFSTTADGASAPTERMRINSSGNVGIGGVGNAQTNLYLQKDITGSTTAYSLRLSNQIQSDVTSSVFAVRTDISTQAASFALTNLRHYTAVQNALGAGSSIGNQYGFVADASLIGATNNYGFYGNIASGTGRYNFYAAGTADNYFGGATTISTNSTTDALRITQTGTGNALLVEDSANPDATPVVIDNSGYLVVGHTGRLTTTNTGQIQSVVTAAGNAFNAVRFSSTTSGAEFNFAKSDSDTIGTNTVVASGDTIGNLSFSGADGTNYIRAAQITAVVDGTPGTNDMPGRLVFSTTADGASSPTERMRIDNAGNVQIGGTAAAGTTLRVLKNITGAATANAVDAAGVIQSDVTTTTNGFRTFLSTAAAAFTLPTLNHFAANQITIGATSAVTNQRGFTAESNLTGATNNYGFYGNIASGTGRYNFYAAGTADNYFGGNTTISAPAINTSPLLTLAGNNNASGATNTLRFTDADGSSALDQQLGKIEFYSADATTGDVKAYIGSFSEGLNPFAYLSFATAATTTPIERMRIDSAGNVGIGGASQIAHRLYLAGTLAGASTAYGMLISPTFSSDATANVFGARTNLTLPSAASSLVSLFHYAARLASIGTTTVTNQYGFIAESSLTGATNNYGFYSSIASGTGRWNFYANGTALNYFNGGVEIGRTAVTAPAASDGNVFSGTYTPTLTNTTNVAASTASVCQYMRVGNVVTVSGVVNIDATATGDTAIGFSLPIASNFGSSSQCGGVFTKSFAASTNAGGIYADSTNDRATFRIDSDTTADQSYTFTFTYRVI